MEAICCCKELLAILTDQDQILKDLECQRGNQLGKYIARKIIRGKHVFKCALIDSKK
jgi:hypothetical protein